jgi:hypothetical protein
MKIYWNISKFYGFSYYVKCLSEILQKIGSKRSKGWMFISLGWQTKRTDGNLDLFGESYVWLCCNKICSFGCRGDEKTHIIHYRIVLNKYNQTDKKPFLYLDFKYLMQG